jgi:hypothetical protein
MKNYFPVNIEDINNNIIKLKYTIKKLETQLEKINKLNRKIYDDRRRKK